LTLANKASTLKADREAIDKSMGQVSISGSAENGDEQFASIQAISDLAGAGQTEKAEELRQSYLTEIAATRLNSVDDLGEASFQEGDDIDAQIETLRQYRENL
jgi:hypothetical protein